MIDIHSHILPNIDDGLKSIDELIEILNIYLKEGVDKIVATPHFIPGKYEKTYQEIIELTKDLNTQIKSLNLNIEIIPGQEIYITKDTLKHLKDGLIGPILNTRYLLIEFPHHEIPNYALDIIYELKIKGYTPIIAHPERYRFIIENIENINKFIEEGCLFQINSGSILGQFGKRVEKTSKELLESSIYSFIGSDSHDILSRKPNFLKSCNKIRQINRFAYDKILSDTQLLFGNENIETPKKIKRKRSIFQLFMGRG